MKAVKAVVISLAQRHRSLTISCHLILLPFVVIAFVAAAQAQSPRDIPRPLDEEGSLVDEMRGRLEIKYAEKEKLEEMDRAREAAQLSSELYSNYSRSNAISESEKKKLDRLEKVTKKIRSRSGGSDGDIKVEDLPNQLGPILKRLAEKTNDMRKAVEKTPRQIVSATVIESANEVLQIIRFVRSFLN